MPLIRQTNFQSLSTLALMATLCAVGCDSHPEVAPVIGRITIADKPPGPGRIIFMPDKQAGNSGKAAMADFDRDGHYRLTTFQEGDGAVVGAHKIIIQGESNEMSTEQSGRVLISPKYHNAGQPLLEATVKPGIENELDFDLEVNP